METILKKIAVERLASVLKEYVVGLDEDKLQMDSDKGEIRLTSLRLKEHDLPGVGLLLKGGYIQTLSLRVPWKRLKKESVVVTVDQVFLVLGARAVTGARAAPLPTQPLRALRAPAHRCCNRHRRGPQLRVGQGAGRQARQAGHGRGGREGLLRELLRDDQAEPEGQRQQRDRGAGAG